MTIDSDVSLTRSPGLAFLNLTSLILSIYVLLAMLCQAFLHLTPDIVSLLDSIDTMICIFFIAEFFYRLWSVERRLEFLKWNWIDLVSSIPAVDVFRWGRVFRILRLLRAVRSLRVVVRVLMANRKSSMLNTVLLISFLLMLFSSVAILMVEDQPDSNIRSPADALWWAFVSITTVGYGDKYPITVEGRIIAVLLVTAGISLYGTLSGFIAAYLIEPEQRTQEGELQSVLRELALVRQKLEGLEQLLAADRHGGKARS